MTRRDERILAIPPAAAKRLEERGGVPQPCGNGLHAREVRLLVALLGAEQRQWTDGTEIYLLARNMEGLGGGALGPRLSLERCSIELYGAQRVRHVLESRNNGGLVLGCGLLERSIGGALVMQEAAASKQRLR